MTTPGTTPSPSALRARWGELVSRVIVEAHKVFSERDQFGYVLALIVVTLVLRAWAGDTRLGLFISVVLGGVTLTFILHTSGVHKRILRAVDVFVVFAIVTTAISLVLGSESDGHQLAGVFGLAIAFLAPFAIVRRIAHAPVITFRIVLGALAIYLLFGLAYSYLYGFVAFVQGTPFFNQTATPNSAIYLYFSYITMATVGYGDYTPATDLGRMLAVSQALLGQLYLVSVVAVIVGNLGRVRASAATSSLRGNEALGPDVMAAEEALAKAKEASAAAADAVATVVAAAGAGGTGGTGSPGDPPPPDDTKR